MPLNPRKWPISFTASLIANVLYYALLIPGMLAYPGYNPFIDAVSSIGAVTRNPNGWFFFSIALILIGFVMVIYYIGFNYWYQDMSDIKKKIRIVQIFGICDSISLALIAVFPTDIAHPPHEFFSILDFIFIILTILVLNNTLFAHPSFNKKIAYFGYFVIGISALYGILAATISDITILEHLSFMTALLYALIIGIKMLKNQL
ncbi:MAG: DUF998 domain-containing protein [Candidatus Helarchaeota archaeon]